MERLVLDLRDNPGGHVFDEVEVRVQPGDPEAARRAGHQDRLAFQVGNHDLAPSGAIAHAHADNLARHETAGSPREKENCLGDFLGLAVTA